MSLPGTRVIHRLFSSRHQPTTRATMTAECTITQPSTTVGATLPQGTYVPPAPTTLYSGPCRVQPRTSTDRLVVVGEKQVTFRTYDVALPADAPQVQVGALVTVTAADDQLLVGRRLRVLDHTYSSLHWQRNLVCEDDLG